MLLEVARQQNPSHVARTLAQSDHIIIDSAVVCVVKIEIFHLNVLRRYRPRLRTGREGVQWGAHTKLFYFESLPVQGVGWVDTAKDGQSGCSYLQRRQKTPPLLLRHAPNDHSSIREQEYFSIT